MVRIDDSEGGGLAGEGVGQVPPGSPTTYTTDGQATHVSSKDYDTLMSCTGVTLNTVEVNGSSVKVTNEENTAECVHVYSDENQTTADCAEIKLKDSSITAEEKLTDSCNTVEEEVQKDSPITVEEKLCSDYCNTVEEEVQKDSPITEENITDSCNKAEENLNHVTEKKEEAPSSVTSMNNIIESDLPCTVTPSRKDSLPPVLSHLNKSVSSVLAPLADNCGRLGGKSLGWFTDQDDDDLTSLAWLQDINLLKNITTDRPTDSSPRTDVVKSEEKENDLMTSYDFPPITNTLSKPPFSFSCLIFMAIESSANKKLPVKEIYRWIVENYPFFKRAPTGWRNSVRHNLSLNKCFKKVDKIDDTGKGSSWCIEPQYRQTMLQSLKRTPYHPYHQIQISCSAENTYSPQIFSPIAQHWDNSFYGDVNEMKSEEVEIEIDDVWLDKPSKVFKYKKHYLHKTSAEDLDVANTLAGLAKFINHSATTTESDDSSEDLSDDDDFDDDDVIVKTELTSTPVPSNDHSYVNSTCETPRKPTSTPIRRSESNEMIGSRRFLLESLAVKESPASKRKSLPKSGNRRKRSGSALDCNSNLSAKRTRTARKGKEIRRFSDSDLSTIAYQDLWRLDLGIKEEEEEEEGMIQQKTSAEEEKELRDGVHALLHLANFARNSTKGRTVATSNQGESLKKTTQSRLGSQRKRRGRPTLSEKDGGMENTLKISKQSQGSNKTRKKIGNKRSAKDSK